ncbi:MAG: hypothetical protein ACXVA9_14085, partial [Bdellovibrionales bacterium]
EIKEGVQKILKQCNANNEPYGHRVGEDQSHLWFWGQDHLYASIIPRVESQVGTGLGPTT